MDYDAWRAFFFNVKIDDNSNKVVGHVFPGNPHGVPRIQQALRPRTSQPHERGFINTNSNINHRYNQGVDTGNFTVSTPQLEQVHGTAMRPIGGNPSFATPSTKAISNPIPSRPGISGGGSGVQS